MLPISKPYIGEEEAASARMAILSGWITQGPRVEEFEKAFAFYIGSKYACAVSNCTAALHLALLAVGVGAGDMVITVSHSFIATANSIRHCGAEPLFVDIEPETYNMSPESLKGVLNKACEQRGDGLYYKKNMARIAAIMPVHQMGMPCDLGSILPLARRHKIPVVEDAACAIGSEITVDSGTTWDKIGKPHGDIACFSLHPRKLITTGEGGMITTNNKEFNDKICLLKQHGMSISDRTRHTLKKVTFEEYLITGYNYRMSDIQAAIGLEQLTKLPGMLKERNEIAEAYREEFSNVEWLKLPSKPVYCRSTNWQSFPVRVLDGAPIDRDTLMQILLNRGVATRRGIMNAHQEKAYLSSGEQLGNSELARDSVILCPFYNGLTKKDIKYIANIIKGIDA